jgi:hypothetical protein
MSPISTFLTVLAAASSATAYGITYYTGTSRSGTPHSQNNLAYGTCYDVDPSFNDQVRSAYFPDGLRCVFWENNGCKNDHTNALDISTNDFSTVCPLFSNWANRVSSFRCCVDGPWCAGGEPKCT